MLLDHSMFANIGRPTRPTLICMSWSVDVAAGIGVLPALLMPGAVVEGLARELGLQALGMGPLSPPRRRAAREYTKMRLCAPTRELRVNGCLPPPVVGGICT